MTCIMRILTDVEARVYIKIHVDNFSIGGFVLVKT
jgi:hypothetical protein